MQRILIISFVFAAGVLLQAQSSAYDSLLMTYYRYNIPTISCNQLAFEMSRDPDLVILDIRETNEYQVSHIEGAQLVAYNKFSPKQVKDIPKDQKIVVYCSIGARSAEAASKLKAKGYTNVYNLYGGIFEWKNNGNAVMVDEIITDSVHGYSPEWGIWLKKGVVVYE